MATKTKMPPRYFAYAHESSTVYQLQRETTTLFVMTDGSKAFRKTMSFARGPTYSSHRLSEIDPIEGALRFARQKFAQDLHAFRRRVEEILNLPFPRPSIDEMSIDDVSLAQDKLAQARKFVDALSIEFARLSISEKS